MSNFSGIIALIVLFTALLWFAIGWWVASIERAKQQRNREAEWTHNLNTLRRDRDAFRDEVEIAHGKIRVLENRRADGQSPPRSAEDEAATKRKMAQMQNLLDQARQKINGYAKKIEELSEKSVAREDALEQLRKKLTDTSRALHERDQKLTTLGSNKAVEPEVTSTIQNLRMELQSEKDLAEQDRERLDHTIGEHMQTIGALHSELAQRDKVLASSQHNPEALDTVRHEMEKLKKENRTQAEKIEQLSQGSKVVEHQRARLNALQKEHDDQQQLIRELEQAVAVNEQHTSTIVVQSEQLRDHQQTNDQLAQSHAELEQQLIQAFEDLEAHRTKANAHDEAIDAHAHKAEAHNALLNIVEDHKITISRLEKNALDRENEFDSQLLETREAMAAQEHIVAQLRDVLSKPTSSPARSTPQQATTYPARIAQPQPQSGDLFARFEAPARSIAKTPSVQLFEQAPPASDNLKKINGIGPVFERALNKLGLYTFKQISELSDSDIEWVADELRSFPDRILNGNWVEQARKLLAEQD